MKFIFHAGMGKTGSSSIQAALRRSGPVLKEHGAHYLGMWAPWMGPEYNNFGGFRRFLDMPKARMDGLADLFLAYAKRISDETGTQTFIHSNEDWPHPDFFRAVAQKAEIEVLIYVRAPDQWLPSAYLQWGILHKTRRGPIPAFGDAAREFLSQYERVRIDWEALGPRLVVRPYPENGDVLPDFSEMIGVPLIAPPKRIQVRPGVAETILRASFNETVHEEQLPQVFDAATSLPGEPRPLPTAQARYDRLFDRSELPAILAENKALFDWFETEFGVPMGMREQGQDPAPSFEELADSLLGYLIDLFGIQARKSLDLQSRLEQVEKSLAGASVSAPEGDASRQAAIVQATTPSAEPTSPPSQNLSRVQVLLSKLESPMSHQVVTNPAEAAPHPEGQQAQPTEPERDSQAHVEPASDLDVLRQQVAERDELLGQARDELRALVASTEPTEALLARQSLDLEQAAKARNALESKVEQLSADLARAREGQGRLDQLLTEARRDLATLKSDASRAMRSELEAQLSKREIAAFKQDLAASGAELEQLRTLHRQRESELHELRRQKDEALRALREQKDEEIRALRERKDAQLKSLRERREAQVKHVAELERHLKELQASTSWRITGPLRRVRMGWRRT